VLLSSIKTVGTKMIVYIHRCSEKRIDLFSFFFPFIVLDVSMLVGQVIIITRRWALAAYLE
jgi:hypothetical protein